MNDMGNKINTNNLYSIKTYPFHLLTQIICLLGSNSENLLNEFNTHRYASVRIKIPS